MNAEGPSELAWCKSSYSSGEGGECLEAAPTWRKSSYSDGEGGECVEVAPCPTTVHIRDSKQPPSSAPNPNLTLSPSAWKAFLSAIS